MQDEWGNELADGDGRMTAGGAGLRSRARAALAFALVMSWSTLGRAALSGSEPSGDLQLAYIDPGAGSFLIQALVAAAAGIAVTVRLYWSRIRRLFGLGGHPDANEDDDPSSADASRE